MAVQEDVYLGLSAYGLEVSAQGGCIPPSVDRMTDACENITFPQLLLRTVKKTDPAKSIKSKWHVQPFSSPAGITMSQTYTRALLPVCNIFKVASKPVSLLRNPVIVPFELVFSSN